MVADQNAYKDKEDEIIVEWCECCKKMADGKNEGTHIRLFCIATECGPTYPDSYIPRIFSVQSACLNVCVYMCLYVSTYILTNYTVRNESSFTI